MQHTRQPMFGRQDPSQVRTFQDPLVLQPRVPNAVKQVRKTRIFIDNRDRISGTPFNFRVSLEGSFENFTNVSRIQLNSACMAKVQNEDYYIIQIRELQQGVTVTGDLGAVQNNLAVTYFDNGQLNPGDTKQTDLTKYGLPLDINPPLARLSDLSISVLKHGGQVVTPADCGGKETFSMLLDIEWGLTIG